MDKKHIVIIDDDARVLNYLKQGLGSLGDGYHLSVANSANDALSICEATAPDLVLSDLRMPDMDGLELIKLLKAMHPKVKLIMMTAYGTDEVQKKASELGVYRFMTKPFRIDNLLSIIHGALNEKNSIAVGSNGVLIIPDACLIACQEVLSRLRAELRPELALMGDMAGHVVTHVGTTMGLDLNSIVALVAGNFSTTSELDRIFDRARFADAADEDTDDKPMYITYQEGRNYDCYSANVSSTLFFTVIFNRQDAKNKAGMVWLHMRRTFRELQQIILEYITDDTNILENTEETVTDDFNKMFAEELEKDVQ